MSIHHDPRHYGVQDCSEVVAPDPWWKVIATGLLLVVIFVASAVVWPDAQSYFDNRDCARQSVNCGE